MNVRKILAILMALCMGILAVGYGGGPAAANAADFPTRTIRVIVAFGAGGVTDLMARALIPEISNRLGGA